MVCCQLGEQRVGGMLLVQDQSDVLPGRGFRLTVSRRHYSPSFKSRTTFADEPPTSRLGQGLNGSRNAYSINDWPGWAEAEKEKEADHEDDNGQQKGVLHRSGSRGSLRDGELFLDSIWVQRVHRGYNGSGAGSESWASRLAGTGCSLAGALQGG